MLSGDNGILQKATNAKTQTGVGQEKETIALAYNSALAKKVSNGNSSAVTDSELNDELDNSEAIASGSPIIVTFTKTGNTYEIDSQGVIKPSTPQDPEIPTLPTALGTKPYFPSNSFSQVVGTDLSTGLVITDAVDTEGKSIGNEYVWIEVPNKLTDPLATFGVLYPTGTTKTDYSTIKTALDTYCGTLIEKSATVNTNPDDVAHKTTTMGWKDEWYDSANNIASSNSNINDIVGCGLTSNRYTELYNAMLSSIFEHGGFWIGRYEAGILEARTTSGEIDANLKPLSKQNVYPILYVTCSQAQEISSRTQNIGTNYNSSLMFGIQWDLVLKYLENKATWSAGHTASSYLTEDSSSWGAYYGTSLVTTIANAKENPIFMTNSWGDVVNNTKSDYGGPLLLSTGSLIGTDKLNIFDIAGNVFEWTLEHATSDSRYPCAKRGGCAYYSGAVQPSSYRHSWDVNDSSDTTRFSCLYILTERGIFSLFYLYKFNFFLYLLSLLFSTSIKV